MIKLRVDGANIYVKSGLIFLGIAALAIAALLLLWPATEPARFLLFWLVSGSLLGGLVLYLIGRVSHMLNRRGTG